MNINKKYSVCFSGYEPDQFPFDYQQNEVQLHKLHTQIEKAIVKALDSSYRKFFTGMVDGFDLVAAETLLKIKEEYPQYKDIYITAVIPYPEYSCSENWQKLFDIVKSCANQIIYISPKYTNDCFQMRNQYIIDNSSYMICFWNSDKADISPVIKMAKDNELFIDNLEID